MIHCFAGQNVAKLVLVSIGVNVRTVSFSTPASSQPATTEIQALSDAIRIDFKDILQPGQEFFLQLKSEEWGGEFIDLQGTQEIADQSVVRAVIKPVTEVNQLALQIFIGYCLLLYFTSVDGTQRYTLVID